MTLPRPHTTLDRPGLWVALIPCLIGTIALGLLSNGVHHDDDLTHYLMARWARWFPVYLLHVWGRPGATIPMAAVAWVGDPVTGWHACRILSALVTASTAYLAARLAQRKGIGPPWLVVAACYLQPFNTLLAGTTLTETFMAFYLVAALSLLDAGRILAGSLVFSIVLLTRHEALVLLPIWWLTCAVGRLADSAAAPILIPQRLAGAMLAVTGPIAHNLLHRLTTGKWPARVFFHPSGSTEYAATSVLGYLPAALQALPPVIFALAVLGGCVMLRRRDWLMPALAGTFFLAHCAVTALGVFASGGYARFMVGIAPLVAVLAVAGLCAARQRLRNTGSSPGAWWTIATVWLIGLASFEIERRTGRLAIRQPWLILAIRAAGLGLGGLAIANALFKRQNSRTALRRIAVAAMAVITLIQIAVLVRPLHLRPAQDQVANVIAWLNSSRLASRPIYATDPWLSHWMNHVENPLVHKGWRLLSAMPVGTIVVWDSIYSPSDYHGVRLAALRADADHFRFIRSFDPLAVDPQKTEIHVFEKIAPMPIPPDPDRPYPPTFADDRVYDSYYVIPR